MHRWTISTILGSVILLAIGCVSGPDDRCFLHDVEYRQARRVFERTQSIDLVRQGLDDADWPQCKANEAIYRIEKEFGLKDQLPSPRRIRPEAELMAEEENDRQFMGGRVGLRLPN